MTTRNEKRKADVLEVEGKVCPFDEVLLQVNSVEISNQDAQLPGPS